eukprot:scaffold2326_cov171-Amphora_coffeaeformis.AAC.3
MILIAFVLGNSVPPLIVLLPERWTKQDDNARCQINTLLGSIGAPPLEKTNGSHSSSFQEKSVHAASLSMVKSYVAWIEAAEHTLQILRTATALDLGHTTTLASCSPVVDRLELSVSGRHRRRTRRIPLYRLRQEVWRLLERQLSDLEALVVVDDVDENDKERGHCGWANVVRKEPQIITLAELRLACGNTAQMLSKATNHLLAAKASPGELLVKIIDATRRTREARSYLECWIWHTKDEDYQSSNVLKDLNSVEEGLETLQVALQCLRESNQQKPLAASDGDDRKEWNSFRRVFTTLHEQVERMEQIYLLDDETPQESNHSSQQKEPRISVGTPIPERVEYCSKSEHGFVTITDRPEIRDEGVGKSATLVFAGRGTRDLQHARSVSKQKRRRTNPAASAQQRPDHFISEQNMLDELRRHLEAMPSSREVEINNDGEIDPTTLMKSLDATAEMHDELLPHINRHVVVNDLAAAVQLLQPTTDEYTME